MLRLLLWGTLNFVLCTIATAQRPNILFVISDDQSYPHASAYGSRMVATPGFDFVAKQGALFTKAYVTSPGCSPSRASILTGLYPWQIEEAGSHASSFSSKYSCFPDILEKAGYRSGYTGKGWAPGNWEVSGRSHNPAGPEFNKHTLTPPYSGISKTDYTANFIEFLKDRKPGQPFYFWLGTNEPHRPFEDSSWLKNGYSLQQATVPGFLPQKNAIKSDLLDYATEISWFDSHLVKCIDELKRCGEFDNTIIIVTADNGMSFPFAKANCTDAGIHVPLAICWGNKVRPGQIIDVLVSSIDLAPTILAATGLQSDHILSGQSLLPLLNGNLKAYHSNAVYAGRERHSFSRFNNMGYPMRSIRWDHYLLIRNFHPERWPAGDPQELLQDSSLHDAFYDIDDGPSKQYLIAHRNDPDVAAYFNAAMGQKRPEYELYDLQKDSSCLHNLAGARRYAGIFAALKKKLDDKLVQTKDTRLGSHPEIWETYPRLEGKMRNFRNQQ
ncbi:MAG TPA: sulfatase [Flavisolibacter sp.]|nr:sulfatase [Flavisolibacter sp.]